MCDNVKGNPFAGLFSTVNDAVSFSSQHQAIDNETSNHVKQSTDTITDKSYHMTESEMLDAKEQVDKLMRGVFGLVLCSNEKSPLQGSLVFIDTDSIEHAVFERLMLPDPKSKLTSTGDLSKCPSDSHVVQTQVIYYLYESYYRLKHYPINDTLLDTIEEACQIVLRNANTALQEPDLFQNQQVYKYTFNNAMII